ncbi:HTH domain protein [Ruminiclostridium hungatei]|uniref:HTH domain protein n=1 Tax=Ruminiclostridium hungatei TaxID=48256 RepID=A0A1V4SHF3_RUMHU|nr:YafY family protein [Ruminiclostridium hungatei]OPX43300.1 HTH domain protein [Ruminiclostridium hungatei]
MHINRLFETVYLLLDRKSITAGELAEHFEVSVRTIYRDIDVLSQAGIPVYMSKGKGGGIRLLDNYVLNKSILSDSEQKEILAALQGLNAVHYPEVDNVIAKLGLLFNKADYNWVDVDFSHWGETNRQKFNMIKTAIINRRVLAFDYSGSYGESSNREIEPVQLWFKDKTWYLKGFCLTRKALRIFRLTRMKEVRLTETTFEKRTVQELELSTAGEESRKIAYFKLHLDKSVAYRVYDEFDEKYIIKNRDGSFEVTAFFPESDWVYGYILSFGSAARVIEPEYIRNKIIERLKETMGQYER